MANLTLDHIRDFDAGAIALLSAAELNLLINDMAATKAALGAVEDRLRTALSLKFGARAQQRRAEEGKDTGTVRFEEDGYTIVADLPKRVKWDQDLLRGIAQNIRHDWNEDPAQYIRTELKVSETAYSAWPDSLRTLFAPARTVETGRPTYRILPNTDEAL